MLFCMNDWKKFGQAVLVKFEPRLVSKTVGSGAAVGDEGPPTLGLGARAVGDGVRLVGTGTGISMVVSGSDILEVDGGFWVEDVGDRAGWVLSKGLLEF